MVDTTYQQCINKLKEALKQQEVGKQIPKGRAVVFSYLELKLKIKFLNKSIEVYESQQEMYAKKVKKYNNAAMADDKEDSKLQFDIIVQLQNDKEELGDIVKQINKDKKKHTKLREEGKLLLWLLENKKTDSASYRVNICFSI